MKTVFHSAQSRGKADHGWLKANFSFSFGSYYNPERIHFGMLRVMNDDIIDAGQGFGWHPHDNMEIVTIPLKGGLMHKDSKGNEGVIMAGDVQIMSAGTGIYHSEFNASDKEAANTLQLWVFPKLKNIEPRYAQKTFEPSTYLNQWQKVVSPVDSSGLWINQDAEFSLGKFKTGDQVDYQLFKEGNGAYVFLIEGKAKLGEQVINKRDAIGVSETDRFSLEIVEDAHILIIDIPMR